MLVTHLAAGRWRATPATGAVQTLTVAEDSGATWLEGAPGTWTLSFVSNG
jgi:hypothetical protein